METRHPARKLTYADFVRFPDDNLRHEIIDGTHVATPAPATKHQRISMELSYLLKRCLEEHHLGEVFHAPFDVLLSRFDIVEPDLVYLSHERAARFLTEENLQGPPDLVVEILSPSTRRRDRGVKLALYERVGVAEYWLVDPEAEEVAVYRRGRARFDAPIRFAKANRDVLTTPLLPGLEIPLPRVFGP